MRKTTAIKNIIVNLSILSLHAIQRNKWTILSCTVALLFCGGVLKGGHAWSEHIRANRVHITRMATKRAISDGTIIRPHISVHAKRGFANEFANLNDSLPKQYQITPSLEIAQAALESNWGTSTLFKKANNPWGVKGEYYGKYLDYETNEYNAKGKKYTEMSKWKEYPSLEDAVEDHNKLLLRVFLKGSRPNDYVSEAKALQHNKYATDPNYAKKLMYYIQKNNLTRFD